MVLVLAAFGPELDALRAARPELPSAAVGVGLAAAALGAEAALRDAAAEAVVLIGTCGAYEGSGLRAGDVVVPARVHLVSTAVAEARAALPDAVTRALPADESLAAALRRAGGVAGDVATTLAITTDDALAGRVHVATGCAAEHLEAFAVALACKRRGVAFAAALGVANAVGSRGRAEWHAQHLQASAAAARVVVAALR